MSNCLTCKHNDRRAKMCTLQDIHTDLGHVLNCAMWTPTDEAVIKQLKAENARLLVDNARLQEVVTDDELHMRKVLAENAKLRELCADMVKMLVLARWDSVESDEEASQCIYRAEALGIGAEE